MKTILRTVKGYRRRRVTRRKRTGMRKRVMHGGFLGNILRGINSVARSIPIVSTALGATGNPLAAGVARTLGYRRKRRTRKMGGFMRGFMGAIPLAINRGLGRKRKRVHRGGFKRVGAVQFGSFRRRGLVKFGSARRPYGVGLRMAPKRRLIQPRRIGMRRRRTQRGRGLMDILRKVHDFAKSNRLVSKGLSLIPHKYAQAAAPIASSLGYRRRRTRRMMGGRYLPGVSYF